MPNHPLMIPLLVAFGAILGALCRYYLTLWFNQSWGTHFPHGTFIINLSGSLLIGFSSIIFPFETHPYRSALVITGFFGSYTTFSTYQLETSSLLKLGQYKKALVYGLGSAILGFICVELGMLLARFVSSFFLIK